MPKKTKPQGDIPYVVPGSVDPDAYEATPIEQKRARRAWAKQNQEYILQELARGRSLEDLGIRDVKEEGRSMYRMLAQRGQQGFQDPNFTYDWANGVKYNHATSDVNARGRAIPIDPREYAERDAQMAFGTGPDAWIKRLQSDSQNQLRTWAQQNAVKGGALRQDESGRFFMTGDNGERVDFDAYGNLIDANTGEIIGDQYGMGTDLLGQAAARGYKSPYGSPGATNPAAPPKYPDSPTASSGRPPITGPTGTSVTSPGVSSGVSSGVSTGKVAPPLRSAWGTGGGVSVTGSRPQPPVRPMQPMQQSVMKQQPRRTAYGSQYGVF